MEKHLENIYREEFIRQKARHDFDNNLKVKTSKNKKNKFTKQLISLSIPVLWGILGFYLLLKINSTFIQ